MSGRIFKDKCLFQVRIWVMGHESSENSVKNEVLYSVGEGVQ